MMFVEKDRLRSGGLYFMFTVSCLAPLFMGVGFVLPIFLMLLLFMFLNPEKLSSANALYILIPVGATAVAYMIFYKFSPIIWAKNPVVDPDSLTPWVRDWYLQPRDGIEVYVAYLMTLTILPVTVFVYFEAQKAFQPSAGNKLGRLLIVGLVGVALVLYSRIAWHVPFPSVSSDPQVSLAVFTVLCALWAFFALEGKFPRLRYACLFILLLPVCFIPVSDTISMLDYSFILDPTLRLLSGIPVSDVYLQYDLFLSLICMPFLALKLSPMYIQIVAQLSVYILFAGIVLYARKWIRHRNVLIAMILTIVVVKVYGLMVDPTMILQVTPLRLDWWLLPAVLMYCFGMYHWSVGISLGMLVVFHKTFGLLYTLAYLEGLAVFFAFRLRDSIRHQGIGMGIRTSIIHTFKGAWRNGLCIALGIGLTVLLYHRLGLSDAARWYQEFGIGFDRISRISFFWYIPVLLGCVGLLLIGNRKLIGEKYFVNGVFLILFAVGNCIYFFGRSHEHNLINIATVIFLILFMGIDIIAIRFEAKHNISNGIAKHALYVFPLVILLYAAYYYSAPLASRVRLQAHKLKSSTIFNPRGYDFDIQPINQATHGSSRIFVLSMADFPVYYNTNSVPPAYFTPYLAWIDKQALIKYAQKLLDDGYYIICQNFQGQPEERYLSEIITRLEYGQSVFAGAYTVLSK